VLAANRYLDAEAMRMKVAVREDADGEGIEVLARPKLRVDAKDLPIVFA
jgi:pyruvate carboxylase